MVLVENEWVLLHFFVLFCASYVIRGVHYTISLWHQQSSKFAKVSQLNTCTESAKVSQVCSTTVYQQMGEVLEKKNIHSILCHS